MCLCVRTEQTQTQQRSAARGPSAMRSLLLSLDPPTTPAVVATPVSAAVSFVESYGWFLLIGGLLLYFGFKQYQEWTHKRRRAALQPPDPAAHAEEVAMKVRQVRLAQQAAWVAAAPSAHRASRAQTDEEKRLQHLYGIKAPADPEADRLTMDEVFGSNLDSEFYKGLKKRKDGKPRDDSSSSSSSSYKSGFNPYKGGGSDKGGGGGGSRRFGSGGPKKGG